MEGKLYSQIASSFTAMQNCAKTGNDWEKTHRQTIKDLCESYMPHGSGIDAGVSFDFDKSKPDHLIFTFGYHQMDENGMYDGWYDYTLHVTPSLQFGFEMRITGKDKNDNKSYFYDLFSDALGQIVETDPASLR